MVLPLLANKIELQWDPLLREPIVRVAAETENAMVIKFCFVEDNKKSDRSRKDDGLVIIVQPRLLLCVDSLLLVRASPCWPLLE